MTFRGIIVFLVALSLLSAVAAQEQSADALHVVITVEGESYVSRYSPPDHYSDGVVLTAGSFVRSNDILEVGPGSRVVILCANRATDEITNDFRSPNCPATVAEPPVHARHEPHSGTLGLRLPPLGVSIVHCHLHPHALAADPPAPGERLRDQSRR